MPTTPGSTANGSFYFLKVDKGLLVADRMVQTNISAQALNRKNYLQGYMQGRGVFRCLSQAEWTKYLTNGNCAGCITKQDNNVWHSVNRNAVSFSYNLSVSDQSNLTINQYLEILQNIKNANVKLAVFLSGKTYDANNLMYFYTKSSYNYASWYVPNYAGVTSINHNVKAERLGSRDFNCYNNYFSFRPAMEYVDNQNSKNIWY